LKRQEGYFFNRRVVRCQYETPFSDAIRVET